MKTLSELLNEKDTKINVTEKEVLELVANDYNSLVGNLDVIDCPICKNKGYIMEVRYEELYENYIHVMKECECMQKRRLIKKIKKSGLGKYITKSFKDYIVENQWQKDIKEKAIQYCKENNSSWFIALGQSGSGKTLICSIIANFIFRKEKKDVQYVTWTDFIGQLKRDMMGDNTNEVSDYFDKLKKVEVLFIDELLKKYNETDLKYLIEIINYRYTNNLKTIITSEKTINELLEIDEATFSRVIEKADKYIINIQKDKTKNYRLKNVL